MPIDRDLGDDPADVLEANPADVHEQHTAVTDQPTGQEPAAVLEADPADVRDQARDAGADDEEDWPNA